jgi:serine/threonine-protein kinase
MPDRWQEVKKVFAGALEHPPSEVSAYLNKLHLDSALRDEVEALLAASQSKASSLPESAQQTLTDNNGVKSGTVLGGYTLFELIGTGGMGEVYRAHDTNLARDVAIKVLPAIFVDHPGRLSRFRREARLLAALNHPNIATIYGLEHWNGVHYLVMELVPGRTLAEMLTTGGVPIDRALIVGCQIAAALEEAHQKGVVHRDLKPANVKLTPEGRIKVLDFGLAKAVNDSNPMDFSSTLTLSEERSILGTPAYMSPEQARGKPVDKQTDIWAFGCLLYELLTARPAFPGETPADTIAAILEKEPDWAALPASTPADIVELLQECLQKSQQNRLGDISAARLRMEQVQASGSAAERAPDSRTTQRGIGGLLPPTASQRIGRRVRPLAIALAGVSLLAGGLVMIPRLRGRMTNSPAIAPIPQEMQLAVLPFKVVGGDTSVTAFSDGLTEMLTAKLTQLTTQHALQVVPASEVRDRSVASSESARQEFGVNLVLTGSLQQSKGMTRVTCELVDTRSHRQLRADTLTIAATDPFAGEDQVVESVLRMLQLELQPAERQTLGAHGTHVADAYDLYLQGRGYLQNYDKVENLQNAITAFQRALATDPNYALAYTGLGQAYWLTYRENKQLQWLSPARDACERALGLDRRLGPAHACLGTLDSASGQYEKAVTEFGRALEAEPTNDDAYRGLAEAYERMGDLAQAEKTYQRAIDLRPHYWVGYSWMGAFYFHQSRFGDAAAMFNQVVALVPDNIRGYYNLGAALNGQGRYNEAIAAIQHSIDIQPSATAYTNLGNAHFYLRQYDDAIGAYEQAIKLKEADYVKWWNLGEGYFWSSAKRPQAPAAYRQAISLASESLQINPKDSDALGVLAICHAMVGEKAAALKYLREGLRLAPRDSEMLFKAALVYNQFGDTSEALKWLGSALGAGYSPTIARDTASFDRLRSSTQFQALLQAR